MLEVGDSSLAAVAKYNLEEMQRAERRVGAAPCLPPYLPPSLAPLGPLCPPAGWPSQRHALGINSSGLCDTAAKLPATQASVALRAQASAAGARPPPLPSPLPGLGQCPSEELGLQQTCQFSNDSKRF